VNKRYVQPNKFIPSAVQRRVSSRRVFRGRVYCPVEERSVHLNTCRACRSYLGKNGDYVSCSAEEENPREPQLTSWMEGGSVEQ